MSGVRPEWLGGQFIQMHVDLVKALGGDFETAAVIWAVKYHAGVGWWPATHTEFMDSTGLTRHKLIRALKRARDEGYVEGRSGSGLDRTMSWRVLYAEASHVPESGTPHAGKRRGGEPESGISSSLIRSTSEEGARKRAAHRLPDDFEPNDTCRRVAAEERVDLDRELQNFRDYWQSVDGKKSDWQATLRVWLRKSRPAAPAGRGGGWQQGGPSEEEIEVREWLRVHPLREDAELIELSEADYPEYRRRKAVLAAELYERAVAEVRRARGGL